MEALELVALLLAEGVCWVEPAKPFSVLEEDWIQTASFGNSHPRPHRGTTNRGRIHVQNHVLPQRSIICATRLRSAPLAAIPRQGQGVPSIENHNQKRALTANLFRLFGLPPLPQRRPQGQMLKPKSSTNATETWFQSGVPGETPHVVLSTHTVGCAKAAGSGSAAPRNCECVSNKCGIH